MFPVGCCVTSITLSIISIINIPMAKKKTEYQQGIYEVQNRDKYVGSANPRYLSSWELVVFQKFDRHPNIKRWGAETVIIPYYSHADQRNRRYMIDLFVEYEDKNGQTQRELIEIKPFCQTQRPVKSGRKKQTTFLKECYTYQVNTDKWAAAAKYAKKRKMGFRILTERDIFL
jgi:hypothetical protein